MSLGDVSFGRLAPLTAGPLGLLLRNVLRFTRSWKH